MPLVLLSGPVNYIMFFMSRPVLSDTSGGSTKGPGIKENKKRPFLVTLSAGALSSVGFGLSIIAISIEWLFTNPMRSGGKREQPQALKNGRRHLHQAAHHRRSLPPSHGSAIRHDRKHTKRVSFASTSTKSQEVQDAIVSLQRPDLIISKAPSQTSNDTSSLSSDTVVAAPSHMGCAGMTERSSTSMTNAPTPSLPATPLPHKNIGDVGVREDKNASTCGQQLPPEHPTKPVASKRSSYPIERMSRITSLRLPRKKASPPATPTTPKPKHSLATSPSVFRKCDRRSEPIPRTLPYAAPYFATPPAPIYIDNVSTLPQHNRISGVSEEMKHTVAQESECPPRKKSK
ncbi:hypothetical protein AX15_005502 [Amanita polypyramis BW_CC]|nr:hypothetical protein AX15_005502 [Amanita polypyramis BW_CC]